MPVESACRSSSQNLDGKSISTGSLGRHIIIVGLTSVSGKNGKAYHGKGFRGLRRAT